MPYHDDAVQRRMFKKAIDREQAVDAVRSWWNYWLMARKLKEEGQITNYQFHYVPYWRVKARVSGTVDGKADRSTEDYTHIYRELILVEGDLLWTKIATSAAEIGIGYLKNGGAGAEACVAAPYPGLPVTLSEYDATFMGCEALEEYAVKETGLDEVILKKVSVVPVDIALVYYPLWVVKYTFSGQKYTATIDGVTGNLIAGSAPGDRLLRKISLIVAVASVVSILALVVWSYFYNQAACCPAAIIAAVLIVVAINADNYRAYGSVIRRGYDSDMYGPFYDHDLENRDILSLDMKIKTLSSKHTH